MKHQLALPALLAGICETKTPIGGASISAEAMGITEAASHFCLASQFQKTSICL